MNVDWVILGVIGFVGLASGFILASILFLLVRTERASEAEQAVEIASEPPLPTPDGRVEVLRLWRREDDDRLLAETQGRIYLSAARLEPDEHTRLALALVAFSQWMEEAPYSLPIPSPAPTLGAAETPAEKAPPSAETAAPPEPRPSAPPEDAPELAEPPRPSLNPFALWTRRRESREPVEEDPAPMTIAAQIDEILQEKLRSASMSDREVRLMEFPKSGMVILVGQDQYRDVAEVPDEEIRALIRESVADWEARAKNE